MTLPRFSSAPETHIAITEMSSLERKKDPVVSRRINNAMALDLVPGHILTDQTRITPGRAEDGKVQNATQQFQRERDTKKGIYSPRDTRSSLSVFVAALGGVTQEQIKCFDVGIKRELMQA